MHILSFEDNREARWQILQQPNVSISNAKNDQQGSGVSSGQATSWASVAHQKKNSKLQTSEGRKGTHLSPTAVGWGGGREAARTVTALLYRQSCAAAGYDSRQGAKLPL